MKKYRIRNITDLQKEIDILLERKNEQEAVLHEKFVEIYEEFHPVNMLTTAISNVFERKTDSTVLLKSALLYGVDALISNVWMKKSSENVRGIVSNVAQAIVSGLFSKVGKFSWDSIFGSDDEEEEDADEKIIE